MRNGDQAHAPHIYGTIVCPFKAMCTSWCLVGKHDVVYGKYILHEYVQTKIKRKCRQIYRDAMTISLNRFWIIVYKCGIITCCIRALIAFYFNAQCVRNDNKKNEPREVIE